MRSLIKYFFHLFLLSLFISCQGTPRTENTSVKAEDREPEINSALWKISKSGEPTSYLLGSLHFGKEGDYLAPLIHQVLAQSDILYTEIKFPNDPDHPTDPDFLEFMNKAYDSKSGKKLEDKIGQERFNEVEKLFQEIAKKKHLKLKWAQLHYMEPWMLSTELPLLAAEKTFSSKKGVDMLVAEAAKKIHIPNQGLENYMYRYKILSTKPKRLILSDIDQVLKNPALTEASMQSMYDLYHSGRDFDVIDLQLHPEKTPLVSIMQGQDAMDSAAWLRENLLKKRNLHWLPQLLHTLPRHRLFIAVGLLHLYGPFGLIQQLRQKGYQVTPITLPQKDESALQRVA